MIRVRNVAAGALAALMLAGAVPALAAENAALPEEPAAQEETVKPSRKSRRKRGSESVVSSDGTVKKAKRARSSEDVVSSDGTVKKAKPARKPSSRPERRTDSGETAVEAAV